MGPILPERLSGRQWRSGLLPAADPGCFSGRSRRRRTETLSRPFHIDQALLPKGARSMDTSLGSDASSKGARNGSLGGTVARPRSSRGDVAGENVADASHALDHPRLVRRSRGDQSCPECIARSRRARTPAQGFRRRGPTAETRSPSDRSNRRRSTALRV